MATTFDFVVSCPRSQARLAEAALDRAHGAVARLEDDLSEFRASSPVARLNSAPVGERVPAPAALIELLGLSYGLRAASGRAFDPEAKSLAHAGAGDPGFAWEERSSPSWAWKTREGARLGFGAVGKGFAVDRARLELEADGFRDYRLDAGGSSIALSGLAGPGTPWRVGWAWMRDADGDLAGQAFEHGTGTAISLGVSGTLEQGRHILDPRTRSAAAGGALSAWVAHPSAAVADALSTALFVLGWERGLPCVAAGGPGGSGCAAAAILEAGLQPVWNGEFARLWGGVRAGPAA